MANLTNLHFGAGGTKFRVWQAPIKDEVYGYEGRGNPVLWFGTDLNTRDCFCAGMKTKREVYAEIKRIYGVEVDW